MLIDINLINFLSLLMLWKVLRNINTFDIHFFKVFKVLFASIFKIIFIINYIFKIRVLFFIYKASRAGTIRIELACHTKSSSILTHKIHHSVERISKGDNS